MPQRSNIVGDLGTTKIASDSYDIDNIYLTDEGWVYRHYKRSDKSKWWDEIIVAGEVPSGDNPQATNPPKLGTVTSPTVETGGDTYKDFQYSTQVAAGGGVPTLNNGSGSATSIGGVNIDTEPGSMTVGVAANFAASIGGDATVTWQWSKGAGSGNATFSAATSATTTVTVDAAGTYTFIAQASSSDAGLTGGSPQSLTSSAIVVSPVTGPVTAVTITNTATTEADGAVTNKATTSSNGSGLTLDYDVTGGVISNANINAAGSGYQDGDTFTIVATGGTATGTVSI